MKVSGSMATNAADLFDVVHPQECGALPPADLAASTVWVTGPVVVRRIRHQVVDALGVQVGPEPWSAFAEAESEPSGLFVQGADRVGIEGFENECFRRRRLAPGRGSDWPAPQ